MENAFVAFLETTGALLLVGSIGFTFSVGAIAGVHVAARVFGPLLLKITTDAGGDQA